MRLPLTLRSASALTCLALVLASSASGLERAAEDAIAPSTSDRLSLTWFDA